MYKGLDLRVTRVPKNGPRGWESIPTFLSQFFLIRFSYGLYDLYAELSVTLTNAKTKLESKVDELLETLGRRREWYSRPGGSKDSVKSRYLPTDVSFRSVHGFLREV